MPKYNPERMLLDELFARANCAKPTSDVEFEAMVHTYLDSQKCHARALRDSATNLIAAGRNVLDAIDPKQISGMRNGARIRRTLTVLNETLDAVPVEMNRRQGVFKQGQAMRNFLAEYAEFLSGQVASEAGQALLDGVEKLVKDWDWAGEQ